VLRVIMLAIGLSASLAVQAASFVFTAIPDEDESRLRERFGRVASYLAGKLRVDVQYIPVKSYAAAVTAFRNNQVQLAWFGGLSGVRARQLVPGSQALAQGFEDQSFKTFFIAHASTGLKPSAEFPTAIAGRTFTFGSKGSTSGRLMPEHHIRRQLGKSPEEVFSRVGFSGDHSKTVALVQSGAYEVGAVNFTVWRNEVKAGNVDAAKVTVIWETPPYPDYQWTIRGDVEQTFGQGFIQRVRQALLDLKDPALLAAFPRSSFIPAANGDYVPIEEVAKSIGLLD
jgi:phosphonate transport system substrate-binding protein